MQNKNEHTKTSPVAVDINNYETTAYIKLYTEKHISYSSQIDGNMTRLTAPTDYEPNLISFFLNQKENYSYYN